MSKFVNSCIFGIKIKNLMFFNIFFEGEGACYKLPLIIKFLISTFFVVTAREKNFYDLRGPIGPLKSKSPSIG